MGLGVNIQQQNEDVWPVLHHAPACLPSSAHHWPLIKAVNPHLEGFSSGGFPGYTDPQLNFSILHPSGESRYLTVHKHPEMVSPHQPCLSHLSQDKAGISGLFPSPGAPHGQGFM